MFITHSSHAGVDLVKTFFGFHVMSQRPKIAKKVFWEFDSVIKQNLSDILPLFCTPTWPSHHVIENQELLVVKLYHRC